MNKILMFLFDWSEVWAPLLPLIILIVFKPAGRNIRWLYYYVPFAFINNFIAIFVLEYAYLVPSSIRVGNNLFYNLHSFLMVILFTLYISGELSKNKAKLLKLLLVVYSIFVLINFSFFESPILLSTRHFTIGSVILISVCFLYFFRTIMDDSEKNWLNQPSFIICSGLCLYEAITFFIFLFIYPLFDRHVNSDIAFAIKMMYVYEGIFVVFCVTLAVGLYRYRQLKVNA